MKREESSEDRLMDALLREDAKGGADEELLAAVEERIDAESAEGRGANGCDAFDPRLGMGHRGRGLCLGRSRVLHDQ